MSTDRLLTRAAPNAPVFAEPIPSWIVPPLSGSVTPVYHHDWPDIEIKPNFIAQPDPWKK